MRPRQSDGDEYSLSHFVPSKAIVALRLAIRVVTGFMSSLVARRAEPENPLYYLGLLFDVTVFILPPFLGGSCWVGPRRAEGPWTTFQTITDPLSSQAEDGFSAAASRMTSTKPSGELLSYLDDRVIEEFRKRADAAGEGYQTMIKRCAPWVHWKVGASA